MSNTKKIGWQKYEDVLERQLTSPFFQQVLKNITEGAEERFEEEEEEYYQSTGESLDDPLLLPIPVSEDLSNQIAMLSSFDCWVGHTNFDITPSVKKTISETKGIEVLKVTSRYRFFIGVGKMFNFKTVRTDIEKRINKDEFEYGDDKSED